METDEGNYKNKRAGRRSVWWRHQANWIKSNSGQIKVQYSTRDSKPKYT